MCKLIIYDLDFDRLSISAKLHYSDASVVYTFEGIDQGWNFYKSQFPDSNPYDWALNKMKHDLLGKVK